MSVIATPYGHPAPAVPSSPPDKPTWAIVVVHGVGENKAGSTLEAFVPPLINQSSRGLVEDPNEPPEVRMLWAEKDNPQPPLPPHVPPLQPNNPAGVPLADRFPAHWRKVIMDPRNGAPSEWGHIAEVYWSDLSATGTGAIHLLKQLFTIIFHLGYVADQAADLHRPPSATTPAAAQNQPPPFAHWSVPCYKWLIYVTSWLLSGPIASLNLLALYFVGAHWLVRHLLEWTGWTPTDREWRLVVGLTAILALDFALWAMWQIQKYQWPNPWPLVAAWSAGWSGLLLLGQIFEFDGLLGQQALGKLLFQWTKGDPFYVEVALLYQCLRLFSGGLGMVVMLAFVLWGIALWQTRNTKGQPIALFASFGALLLQIGMWVVLVPTVAVYAFKLFDSNLLDGTDTPLTRVLTNFEWRFQLALLLLILVVLIWIYRTIWKICDPRPNNPPGVQANGGFVAHDIPRLIVHMVLLTVLIAVAISSTGIALWDGVVNTLNLFWPTKPSYPLATDWILQFTPMYHLTHTIKLTTVILAILGIVSYCSKGVGAVCHVLMDIVSHFYRDNFDPFARLEIRDFKVQQQIEARMRRVLQEVVKPGTVKNLLVVSHSQGTVIAVDVLWYPWTGQLLNGIQVNLVTMGSPLTNLYQHYFPHRYPPLFVWHPPLIPQLHPFNRAAWGDLHDTVQQWLNMYRVDDYVGTYIEGWEKNGTPWPDNQPVVEPGYSGHNDYWGQPKVLRGILSMLPWAAVPPPAPPAAVPASPSSGT